MQFSVTMTVFILKFSLLLARQMRYVTIERLMTIIEGARFKT